MTEHDDRALEPGLLQPCQQGGSPRHVDGASTCLAWLARRQVRRRMDERLLTTGGPRLPPTAGAPPRSAPRTTAARGRSPSDEERARHVRVRPSTSTFRRLQRISSSFPHPFLILPYYPTLPACTLRLTATHIHRGQAGARWCVRVAAMAEKLQVLCGGENTITNSASRAHRPLRPRCRLLLRRAARARRERQDPQAAPSSHRTTSACVASWLRTHARLQFLLTCSATHPAARPSRRA